MSESKEKVHNYKKCYLCKEVFIKTDIIIEHNGHGYHENCHITKIDNEKEQLVWLKMCDYIHKKILGLNDDVKFDKNLALRLKGLKEGKFIVNKSAPKQANYSFSLIYMTIMLKEQDILHAFKKTNFKNFQHKINYMMSIIETTIVDVYIRTMNKKANDAKVEKINTETIAIVENENEYKYKKKSNDKHNDFDEYW